jgi:FAD/FMN-containing dehydrogenase
MQGIAAVFATRQAAEAALAQLRTFLPVDRLNFLTPKTTKEEVAAVPATQDMSPVGSVIGGALGGALGLGFGVATLVVPGLGLITAAGTLAAALLGVGGAVAGVKAFKAVDNVGSSGIPADELFLYRDALRKGRTVIIALADNDEEERQIREVFQQSGAEKLDPARKSWQIGATSDEKLEYQPKA